MKVSDIPFDRFRSALVSGAGIPLCTGPFVVSINSAINSVALNVHKLYANNRVASEQEFVDFHVVVKKPPGVRRFVKSQVQFYFDGNTPFWPLPFVQAYPMLEWGLNFCVSSTAHQFLIIHSAVVEKNGVGIVMPAPPGSGKSTLCAALVCSGWRLLSDELALIDLNTCLVQPLARPVSLKNQSIEIIGDRFPEQVFSNITRDTAKGSVAHMRPPTMSIELLDMPARAKYVIFPRYMKSSGISDKPVSRGQAFMRLIENSFNYSLLGKAGFRTLATILADCNCREFTYSDLTEAITFFDDLALSAK